VPIVEKNIRVTPFMLNFLSQVYAQRDQLGVSQVELATSFDQLIQGAFLNFDTSFQPEHVASTHRDMLGKLSFFVSHYLVDSIVGREWPFTNKIIARILEPIFEYDLREAFVECMKALQRKMNDKRDSACFVLDFFHPAEHCSRNVGTLSSWLFADQSSANLVCTTSVS